MLIDLPLQGCRLGVASRTEQPGWARELLELLGLGDCFDFRAIYPGDKQRHFHQLQSESGVAFEDMLFFDDEERNIRSVGSLGVISWHVERGVSQVAFNAALAAWRDRG